jgi:hypothetical protein
MLMFYHVPALLLLIAAAALQLNDPDPLFWGGFYLSCSLVPALAVFKIHSRLLYGLCLVYGIAAMVLTAGGGMEYLQHAHEESLTQAMAPDKPYIEEAREFLGAIIALCIISVYPLINLKRKPVAQQDAN